MSPWRWNEWRTSADDPAWLQRFVDYIREKSEVANRLIVGN